MSTSITHYLYWPKLNCLNFCAAQNVRPLVTRVWKSDFLIKRPRSLNSIRQLMVFIFPQKDIFKPFCFEGSSKLLLLFFRCHRNLPFSFLACKWDIHCSKGLCLLGQDLFHFCCCKQMTEVVKRKYDDIERQL